MIIFLARFYRKFTIYMSQHSKQNTKFVRNRNNVWKSQLECKHARFHTPCSSIWTYLKLTWQVLYKLSESTDLLLELTGRAILHEVSVPKEDKIKQSWREIVTLHCKLKLSLQDIQCRKIMTRLLTKAC